MILYWVNFASYFCLIVFVQFLSIVSELNWAIGKVGKWENVSSSLRLRAFKAGPFAKRETRLLRNSSVRPKQVFIGYR